MITETIHKNALRVFYQTSKYVNINTINTDRKTMELIKAINKLDCEKLTDYDNQKIFSVLLSHYAHTKVLNLALSKGVKPPKDILDNYIAITIDSFGQKQTDIVSVLKNMLPHIRKNKENFQKIITLLTKKCHLINYKELVLDLCKEGFDINEPILDKGRLIDLLSYFPKEGTEEGLDFLKANNININFNDYAVFNNGELMTIYSPLKEAIISNHLGMVKYLCDVGVKVDIKVKLLNKESTTLLNFMDSQRVPIHKDIYALIKNKIEYEKLSMHVNDLNFSKQGKFKL